MRMNLWTGLKVAEALNQKALRLGRQASLSANDARYRMALRIASRGLVANLLADLDWVARLQVLEGAAGFPDHTSKSPTPWADQPRKAWKNLEEIKNEMGPDIDPKWFVRGNTGLYEQALFKLMRVAQRSGVSDFDVENQMGRYLFGLAKDGERMQRVCWLVGRKFASGIRSGRETPAAVGKGGVGTLMSRKLFSELRLEKKQVHRGPSLDDEGGDRLSVTPSTQDKARILWDVLTDAKDPLGQKIRTYLRSFWKSTRKNQAQREEVMDFWLEQMVESQEPINGAQLARLVNDDGRWGDNVTKQLISSYLTAVLPSFQKAFWTTDLADELYARWEHDGAIDPVSYGQPTRAPRYASSLEANRRLIEHYAALSRNASLTLSNQVIARSITAGLRRRRQALLADLT